MLLRGGGREEKCLKKRKWSIRTKTVVSGLFLEGSTAGDDEGGRGEGNERESSQVC